MTKSQLMTHAHTYARELRLLDPSLPYALALKAGMQEAWKLKKAPTDQFATERVEWFDYDNEDLDLHILGLTEREGLTSRDVRRAYRRRAHTYHPDHGGCNTLMDQLIWAKDAMLDHVELLQISDEELAAMFGL